MPTTTSALRGGRSCIAGSFSLKSSATGTLRNIACIYGYDHAMSFAVRSRLSLSSLADKCRLTHLSFELRLGCTFLYRAPKKLALESICTYSHSHYQLGSKCQPLLLPLPLSHDKICSPAVQLGTAPNAATIVGGLLSKQSAVQSRLSTLQSS